VILGRNPGLWLALIQAAINALVVVLGIPFTVDQVVALNVLGIALVGTVANESDPSTVSTFAGTVTPDR
jgi:uncharacterized membrane protein YccF (DUF307 family)